MAAASLFYARSAKMDCAGDEDFRMIPAPPNRDVHWESVRSFLTTDCLGEREPCGTAIVFCFDSFVAPLLDPDHKPHTPENSFREVIALQGIVVGQFAALLLYIREHQDYEPRAAMAYLAIFSIPLIGLIAIVWSHQRSGDNLTDYVYSRPVRRYGFVALALSLVFVPTTAYLYSVERLPGQPIATIVKTHVVHFVKTGEATQAYEVQIEIPFPTQLASNAEWNVRISLKGTTKECWKILQVDGFRDAKHECPWHAIGVMDIDDEPSQGDALWIGKITQATPGVFWIQIVLDRRDGAAEDRRAGIPTEDVTIDITAA